MTFRELLSNDKFIILDGAMGTMLQKSGLKLGGLPEELNFTNPDLIENIHRQYISDMGYYFSLKSLSFLTIQITCCDQY